MQGKTRAHSDAIINLLRGTPISAITPFVALMSVAPTNDNSAGLECSYVGYARQPVVLAAPIDYVEVVGKRIATTSADIVFGAVPADEDIEAVALFDAVSAGTMLHWISAVDTIPSGETPRWIAGTLGVVED